MIRYWTTLIFLVGRRKRPNAFPFDALGNPPVSRLGKAEGGSRKKEIVRLPISHFRLPTSAFHLPISAFPFPPSAFKTVNVKSPVPAALDRKKPLKSHFFDLQL
ncbi:MAG: hypothetical protein R2828_02045 [Saprospiraceae bacterium]